MSAAWGAQTAASATVFSAGWLAEWQALVLILSTISALLLTWARWGRSWRIHLDDRADAREQRGEDRRRAVARDAEAFRAQLIEMVREYRQERSQLFERIDHLETHAREQDKKLREMEHRYERLRDATSAELAEAKAALSQCGEESRHYQKLYQIAMDALNEARKS